jgi:hypothetical protein
MAILTGVRWKLGVIRICTKWEGQIGPYLGIPFREEALFCAISNPTLLDKTEVSNSFHVCLAFSNHPLMPQGGLMLC